MEQETLGFHERVRKGYLELQARSKKCFLINGMKRPEHIFKEVLRALDL